MADLSNAQRAQLFVDGNDVNSDTPGLTSSAPEVASIATIGGKFWIVGESVGTATISLDVGGRQGSLDVLVSAEPYILTLGTPEPK
jgi:hypothetical protein